MGTSEVGGRSSAMRSVVLVHGAWHRASCWDRVVAGLRERGVAAHAIDLPFQGLAADAAAARAAILAAGEGAIAVGHSYGGIVISTAASGLPSVGHLVYLCALMLAEDDDLGALLSEHPMPLLGYLRVEGELTSIDPTGAVEVFYGDCAPADATAAVAQLRSMPMPAADVPVRPAWRDVTSTYVVCTDDAAIVPPLQRSMSRHASRVVEWPTSHSPFFSEPHRIVELISGLAGA
jgi:pimeloyl-ACP methyl ester carboxylesterase